ncbi:Hydroxyisourate hydrolase [Hordeum vulgare]|nr:Hydroxyisourate hydrolase [Hordeum vulgare]
MTAGRKPASNPSVMSLLSLAALSSRGLQAALGSAGANAKAKRSKATPMSERAPSARSKVALGDLSSLESAQLRLADKNLETSGNPPPSYKILNAFFDPQLVTILDDRGFALGSEGSPVVPMICAREEAQAALAEVADAAKAREANDTAASTVDTVGAVSGALMPVLLGGEAKLVVLLKLDFEKAYNRVNWEFIRETPVSINGELGNFFRNKRGLRQGHPSSPLIFNLVVDALSTMIKVAGHILGVAPHLIPGGVTHLQYVDNTILLFEPNDHGIASIKLILLAFEMLSGLKMNFLKSEVIAMGMVDHAASRVANLLNCNLGSFSIKYLGLPVSDKHISIHEWEPLYGKVANRVSPWRGRFMSSAARLILTNTSLSSLPMFTMGMFLLEDGVHPKLDTPCSKFF